MTLAYASLLAAAVLTVTETSAASSANESSTVDIARAVALVAKMDWEVDVQSLSKYLRLPKLQDHMRWQGPFARYEAPFFSANYKPENSELGIKFLSISWQIGSVRDSKGNPGIFNYLLLGIAPGQCPTAQQLTQALGVKSFSSEVPGMDGGPYSESTAFIVPQNHGAPVQVSYSTNNTCRLTISHIREI